MLSANKRDIFLEINIFNRYYKAEYYISISVEFSKNIYIKLLEKNTISVDCSLY